MRTVLLPWFVSVGIGIGLTLVYLLPALTSLDLVAAAQWDRYSPNKAFAFPTVTAIVYGMSWFSFQWVVPGLTLLSVALATAYAGWRRRDLAGTDTGKALVVMLSLAWVAVFLSSELSYPLWMLDTPLRKVQAPYRLMYVACLPAIAANVICVVDLWRRAGDRRLAAGLALPLALSALLFVALNGRVGLGSGERIDLSANALEPYASYPEYTVAGQQPAAMDYVADGGLDAECRRVGATCVRVGADRTTAWTIGTQAAVDLRLPLLAFPSWAVTANGMPVDATRDEATGLLTVALPAGDHRVEVRWTRLPQERVGMAASAGFAVLLMVGWVCGRVSAKGRAPARVGAR